jgi:hypothetical protein
MRIHPTVFAANLLALLASAQQPPPDPFIVKGFFLYKTDPKCVCARTRKETSTLISVERISKGEVFQVFLDRRSQRELFRVRSGRVVNKEKVTYWNYGIANEADWNEDGQTDYVWYGGDDTSSDAALILSGPTGFRVIGIQRSAEAAWKRSLNSKPPRLGAAGRKWDFANLKLRVEGDTVSLSLTITESDASRKVVRRVPLTIEESDFRAP